jgi:hypothetical protein
MISLQRLSFDFFVMAGFDPAIHVNTDLRD